MIFQTTYTTSCSPTKSPVFPRLPIFNLTMISSCVKIRIRSHSRLMKRSIIMNPLRFTFSFFKVTIPFCLSPNRIRSTRMRMNTCGLVSGLGRDVFASRGFSSWIHVFFNRTHLVVSLPELVLIRMLWIFAPELPPLRIAIDSLPNICTCRVPSRSPSITARANSITPPTAFRHPRFGDRGAHHLCVSFGFFREKVANKFVDG